MALYICKCGRQVNKSTNADNTGNRDTAQCTGCPYLLPWGPYKYVEGQGFHKDVQGYECRMSPTLCYTTTYRGQASDKCTLQILSLDLDFLDTVQAWIDDHAADTLSAGFSRGSMRGTDFSDKGRYSLSISCAQNKKGMAAKAALIEQFFTGGRVRKDMTLAQEKAHILSAIQRGKEQAQRKDQPMKKQNDRCPLQQECERTCKVIGHERDCDYYVNNRYSTGGIPDQDEILTEEEIRRERELEEKHLADLSFFPAEPEVYQNDYGTLFAVREHNGAPALMCKPLASDAWTLSGVLAAVQGEAYTAEDLQEVLDEYARAHGWKPVEAPASAEPHLPMPGDVYQAPQSGQLYKIGELTNGKQTCYLTMRCNMESGTWVPANSSVYPKLSDAQGEFEAWIRTEQLEPVAPTGAAAATTVERAVKEQPRGVEISTTSESGADASTPLSESSSTQGPNSSPAPASPAGAGAATQSLSAAGSASLEAEAAELPVFDYSGLDVPTRDALHWAEKEIGEARREYIARVAQAVAIAHDALCATVVQNLDNGKFTKSEESFQRWCESVGIKRSTAYNLLQVQALLSGATPEEQATLEAASPSLLYAAAKPSAPAELVQAVKAGDITTNKQYQEALAEIRARDAKITDLLDMSEAADRRADKAEQAAKDTARERDAALRRAAEAEKQRDGARDALTASKLRGDKLKAENEALKARPIEARVVDEEEIERRAQARADELTAPMREELEALRARHPADLEEAEQAIRDAYDSAIYTGRVMENAWHTLRPLLPRMDAHRRELAINQVSKTLSQIQGEIAACL